MIVDGKKIAEEILAQVKGDLASFPRPLRLGLLFVNPNFATQKFIAIKEKRATDLGIAIVKKELSLGVTTEEAVRAAKELAAQTDGVIVQLPIEESIDAEALIAAVPPSHDVDGMTPQHIALSPVVAALKEILMREGVSALGKKVTVVGKGRLVGEPAAKWFEMEGAAVVTVDIEGNVKEATCDADIVVMGTGHPGLLTPDMVKEGVVILDAGTSEASGKLAGDADPKVAEKASVFTPVPGGIGPIAVAMIFKNLLELARRNNP